MKKCPYCAEEIQNEAIKCKHCGEFLDPSFHEELTEFIAWRKDNQGQIYVYAKNREEAMNLAAKRFGLTIENIDVYTSTESVGKFSCPQCKSKFTTCEKEIGCFFWILTIITLGLGLIIIWPFLPYHCHCRSCDYDWKS